MDTRQLFIDLDGVLADFDAHYVTCFGAQSNRNTPLEESVVRDNISSMPTFFRDLPPMPDAMELWHGVCDLVERPIILTGLPSSVVLSATAAAQKRAWVDVHLGPYVPMIGTRASLKATYGKPGDALVDDWSRYRRRWERMGGLFILHTSAQDSLRAIRAWLLKP